MSQSIYKVELIERARRVVFKVGSAVLAESGNLSNGPMVWIADATERLLREGREVIIVSSGAIAYGRLRFEKFRGDALATRQAAAAAGQIALMNAWARAFEAHSRPIAQLLLTHQDLAEKRRRANARRTFEALLKARVVPIVNENDTVAVDEIRFGDNDYLSALVAILVEAQLLVLMSDVAGVLSGDPRRSPDARLIPVITDPEADLKGIVTEGTGPLGSGGMSSKIKAARSAALGGIAVIITSGLNPDALAAALNPRGESGTLFLPARRRMRARKHWIAYALRPQGTLRLDQGAVEALRRNGRSLLPSGIAAVEGEFAAGDCVFLVDPDGAVIGRGLVNYPAADVARLKGHRSSEIFAILGYKVADEIINRDNLVLTSGA